MILWHIYIECEIYGYYVNTLFFVFLGASACVKLILFEKAITRCDEGLAVSFEFDCIFLAECKDLHGKPLMVEGRVERCKGMLLGYWKKKQS